jgi:hypothetical protein
MTEIAFKLTTLPLEMWQIFNYFGSILNADNKMYIEIAGKIAKGNKAHYANSKLIK